jgi:hypothetical protein
MVGHGYSSPPSHSPPAKNSASHVSDNALILFKIKTAFAAFSLAASLSPRRRARCASIMRDMTSLSLTNASCNGSFQGRSASLPARMWPLPVLTTRYFSSVTRHNSGSKETRTAPAYPPCLLQRAGVKLASPFGGSARLLCLTILRADMRTPRQFRGGTGAWNWKPL